MWNLESAFARFCRILDLAEKRFDREDIDAAVALAQIAARYAYPGNVGLFASPRLERLLVRIGKSLPIPRGTRRLDYSGRSPRILHILSYARPVGGDTRFVWRWIQEDKLNSHSVVVTTQADVSGVYEIPRALDEAVAESGGSLRVLQVPPSRPLDQAVELRGLCQEADIVVLHVFPYDVIPILSLSAGCESARTVFVNHSDHTFWIGASVSHSIAHLRTQPPGFLENSRSLKSDCDSLLPIPLAHSVPKWTRAQAKAAFGYGRDTVILLTIASPFKYASPDRQGLLELVMPVLREMRQAVLVAVGPSVEGVWREANLQTNGRVIALGARYDNAALYAAADVYLDSVPFSSISSLLEAGSLGVPLLGLSPPEADLGLLGPGAPGLEGVMKMGLDADSYRSLLRRLITDEDYRLKCGLQSGAHILSRHTGEGWRVAVEDVYSKSRKAPQRGCIVKRSDAFTEGPLNKALVNLYGHPSALVMRQMLSRFLMPLRYRKRIAIVWDLYQNGFDLSVSNLLPSSLYLLVGSAVRKARRMRAGHLAAHGGMLVELPSCKNGSGLHAEGKRR